MQGLAGFGLRVCIEYVGLVRKEGSNFGDLKLRVLNLTTKLPDPSEWVCRFFGFVVVSLRPKS